MLLSLRVYLCICFSTRAHASLLLLLRASVLSFFFLRSSDQGRQLFREALVDGTMEIYFRLAEQFRTQDEPAFCGLSTLTMVLNALAVDPGRIWKGAHAFLV